MRRSLSATLLCSLLGLLSAVSAPAFGLLDWQAKIEAGLLDQAAQGPVEVLIYLEQQADLSAAYQLATKLEKGAWVYQQLTSVAAASQPAAIAALELLGAEHRAFWIVNTVWAELDLAGLEAIASLADVAFVYESGFGGLDTPAGAGAVSAQSTSSEWNINLVGAPQAWDIGVRGQGVVVASADTGVFWEHAALKNQYRGWDGATADHDYNWHLGANPNAVCPQFPSTEPCDDDELLGGGHGSHTVGTMVGDDGGVNSIGMAPEAEWIACRNMNFGLGTVPSYLDCMEWFLAPTDTAGQNPDPSKAPHVVNNSWGCVEACPPPILKAQLEASRAAGIFYAVSAGNDGSDCSTLAFPLAIYEAAFSVGATNINDQIAGFSSRGPIVTDVPNPPRVGPNISAPGVGVRSAQRDGGYASLNGTSMAGPHVAGLAALILSANPALAGDVDAIEDIIEQTAVPLTTGQGCGDDTPSSVPNNSFGWGRIDAFAAVLAAIGDALRAVDDQATTQVDVPVTIDVLANDLGPAGATLSVSGLTQPANGSAVENGDGTITYTPGAGFIGVDSFTYDVTDGGDTDTATVTVTVEGEPQPQPPVARDDEADTVVATPITIDVLANDSDPDSATLTVTVVTAAANGSTGTDGATVGYDPDPSFVGVDGFRYTVCDETGLCDSAAVEVRVHCSAGGSFSDDFEPGAEPGWATDTAVNENPGFNWGVAADPFAASPANSFFSDATGLALKDDRLVAPAQDLSPTSTLVFWHRFGFENTFDGGVLELSTDGGATWIDVEAGGGSFVEGGYNGAIDTGFGSPIAGRQAWTGDSAAADAMSRVEVDMGAFAGQDVLVRWRLAQDELALGATPGTGWWIDDVEFTALFQDSADCPVAPRAIDDTATTFEDQPVVIEVLANDSDPNGDPISLGSVGAPANGTADANPDGSVTYTPNPGFVGEDSFDYEVCDGGGLCNTGSVVVTVRPFDPPVRAVDDFASTTVDSPVTIDVLANDADPDNDPLSVVGVTQPANGTVTIDGPGPGNTVTYTPDSGFAGTDVFTYTVSDGTSHDEGTVTVEVVDEPNNPPVARKDKAKTPENTPLVIDVLANDSDPDGDPIAVISVGMASHGTTANNGDGTVTYSPALAFNGKDSFTYEICDDRGACATGQVKVRVVCNLDDDSDSDSDDGGGCPGVDDDDDSDSD